MLSDYLEDLTDEKKRASRIRECYELLGDCSGDTIGGNSMFSYSEILKIRMLTTASKKSTQNLLVQIKGRFEKTKQAYHSNLLHPDVDTLEKSIEICSKYLNIIEYIPEEDISLD